jgi:hypothetical protein
MTSRFEVILASSAGSRYGAQPTIWPSLMREVRWEMAARVVQHSNIVSCAGRGTLWKWSNTQSES